MSDIVEQNRSVYELLMYSCLCTLKRQFTQKRTLCHHLLIKLLSFFLQMNTKEDILKNVGNQTVSVPIDFHSIFPYCSVNNILQNIFCVQQKKLIQVWNNLKVSKWWQNFHFWMNFPFKLGKENCTTEKYSLISTRVPSATEAKLTCISSPCTQHLCCIPPSICDTSPKPSPPTQELSVRHTTQWRNISTVKLRWHWPEPRASPVLTLNNWRTWFSRNTFVSVYSLSPKGSGYATHSA